MNQEQNNLNLNNFNTQGNNEMPNNQPLNNQNFNQSTVFNQQLNTSFQQPIIQNTMPQPINNTFESGNTNNSDFNNRPKKKTNIGLIVGIVSTIIVIIIVILFVLNNTTNNLNDIPSVDNNEIETDENYIAEWKDYTAYIQGVEFVFPMTFKEFQNKIAKTSYELNYHYSLDDKIKSFYSTSNYVEYTNEVRKYNSRTGLHALQYDLKVFLQNDTDEFQPVSNCDVIGFSVSKIKWATKDVTDLPYDKDIFFTKQKLQLGQNMSKKELVKKFGPSNGGTSNYSAGSISAGIYNFPNFQCNIDSDGKISFIAMQNYIEKED